jgi:pimeloyl-ACP methyl ester carboxylesterase
VRTPSRSRLFLPLVVVAGLVLAACSSDDSGQSTATTAAPSDTAAATTAAPDTTTVDESPSTIDWQPCTDIESDAPLECATVPVPLDYDDAGGKQIDIAITRLAATDPARREGAILINPGGPGASGREVAAAFGIPLGGAAPELAERFDLIGFDPRGVGRSNPVRCVDDAWKDRYLLPDSTPDTPVEQADLLESGELLTRCSTELGDTLQEYSTNNTARDMDRIREALGDDQISFYGISYGTLLGATYGGMFPDRVRALVLDSALSPDVAVEPEIVGQLRGFRASFDAWAASCAADTTCPFAAASAAEVTARWQALGDALDVSPLDVGGRPVNREVTALATITALYDRSVWTILAQALADAERGDGTTLQAIADLYNGRNADGTYSNQSEAMAVISCASGLTDMDDLAGWDLVGVSPLFGPIVAASPSFTAAPAFCDPANMEPQASIAFAGTAPVIVIGGTGDPATPFPMAERMVNRIGSKATLVVFDGEGHGQSLTDPCLLEVVTQALLTATAPAAGTVCTQQG